MQDMLRRAAEDALNGRGRSTTHIAAGAALVTGAVLVSALIAAKNSPTPNHPDVKRAYDRLEQPSFKPPREAFAAVWPPLFFLLTISGLRIWNAPDSPARNRALTLWVAIQGLNAGWMALGPKRLPAQVGTAVVTLGASAAYAHQAARVDKTAAGLVAPFIGWIGFANVLTGELFRLNHRKFAPAYPLH